MLRPIPLRIQTLFFASSRDAVGARSLDVELPAGAPVSRLLEELAERYPSVAPILVRAQFAVNQEYSERDRILEDGDEVAVIPPVSGGAGDPRIRIVEAALDPAALHDLVRSDSDGAVVTFSGTVRNHTGDQQTSHLEYEAYASMAERKMAELAERTKEKWAIGDVAIHHRVGQLDIGEISVLASVASPHRVEAFEACRYLIDRLKVEVPVWKKEVGPDGQYWVEGPTGTTDAGATA